jgi:hypothetical protein
MKCRLFEVDAFLSGRLAVAVSTELMQQWVADFQRKPSAQKDFHSSGCRFSLCNN